MRYHPCDEIAADGLAVRREIETETGAVVQLNRNRIEAMVGAIEELVLDGAITDHEEIVGIVLGRYAFRDDTEYSANKRWLDKIFERRLQAQVA